MSNGDSPPGFSVENNRCRRLVAGLRIYEKPTECRVFQLNPDGTVGKLLRVEQPIVYSDYCRSRFNNGSKKK